MKSTCTLAALALASFAVGCANAPDDASVGAGDDALTAVVSSGATLTTGVVTAPASATSAATAPYAAERVYVYDATVSRTCASVSAQMGTWKASRLGASGALSGYCVLEWSGQGSPDGSVLPAALVSDSGRKVYGDRPISAPLAGPTALVDGAWGKLREATLRSAGTLGAPVPAAKALAFVGVADSAREETVSGEASVGTYEHGEAVGRVVREIGGPSSVLSVLSTTALPRDARGVMRPAGGFYGYTSDVALAIVRNVDAWRALTANDRAKRPLVVNLSLGWEAAYYMGATLPTSAAPATGYTPVSVTNLPQRSVFAAIQYANCAGALVLAAAGNVSEGAGATKSLMFPAAWESVARPTTEQCATFGFSATVTPRYNTSPRMVYAVGGVDGADKNLFNARALGMPRLAAYGDAVAVSRATTLGGHTGVFTGSSMAVAVASSVAAYAWSYQPSMSAHDVAQIMYDQSPSLARGATACSYGACTVRRVSLCEVAQRISGATVTCNSIAPNSGSKVKNVVDPLAVGATYTVVSSAAAVPVGASVNTAMAPSVRPMPGSSNCGLCGVSGNKAYFNFSNPSSSVGATVAINGVSMLSFAPSTTYMSVGGLPVGSSGTITFTNATAGWTSTEQLLFF